MNSTPIRQPRGPPSTSSVFSATGSTAQPHSSSPASAGPPPPDAESILRRNKTVANPRTGTTVPSNSTATAGVNNLADAQRRGFSGGVNQGVGGADGIQPPARYRSGSFSVIAGSKTTYGPSAVTGPDTGGIARRPSTRDYVHQRTEEALIETEAADDHDPATERGTWGKGSGLNRQSSLPSRRLVNGGVNPGLFTQNESTNSPTGGVTPNNSIAPPNLPPPRPPRRVYHASIDQSNSASVSGGPISPITATHSRQGSHGTSHSMSSLTAIVGQPYDGPPSGSPASPIAAAGAGLPGAGVSRTQSLRQQAQATQQIDISNLGRSASLRTPGEIAWSRFGQGHASPPPPHIFNATTPPRPAKQSLPPFQFPPPDDSDLLEHTGDLRRHQSLTQGYGRVQRERLERSQALLSLDQREDLRRRMATSPHGGSTTSQRHSRQVSDYGTEDSPTNPIARSVWTPGATGAGNDDGWSRSTTAQQLQEALDALSINGRDNVMGPTGVSPGTHPGDEPAWVTNLVGMPGQPSPQPAHRSMGGGWDERDPLRGQPYAGIPPWAGGHQLQQPLTVFQQQQLYAQAAQLKLAAAAGLGGAGLPGGVIPGLGQLPPLPQGYHGNFAGPGFNPNYPVPQAGGVGGQNMNVPNMPGPNPPLSAQDLDVIELARSKGLNPASFDCRPPYARFFVIKSYIEDDVQKSIKHEVWSSTLLGNKRLDTAFRESADKGPIYLLFSVNGSRHFCAVAQMLSPVDENTSLNIWAQDKWKGSFKLKFIFVRDVPTAALRHIKLNTPERKPITNSRDTQEVGYEAGCEVLQIFLDHQHKSKTSLLQDFGYYERLSANREAERGQSSRSGAGTGTATPQPQAQHGPASPMPQGMIGHLHMPIPQPTGHQRM